MAAHVPPRPFNLPPLAEVHLHVCLRKLQFLLITGPLIAGTCLSAYRAHQRQNEAGRRSEDCPTTGSRGANLALLSPPSLANQRRVHLQGTGTRWWWKKKKEESGDISGKKEMRDGGGVVGKRMESAGFRSDQWISEVRRLRMDLHIAQGWQWPTFPSLSF